MNTTKPIVDYAEVIRSKNSGPFELTFDIIFKSIDDFQKIVELDLINKDLIADLFKIGKEKIINIIAFKAAKAIKITIKRPLSSGAIGETDVYGAQQHAPLLSIQIPDLS